MQRSCSVICKKQGTPEDEERSEQQPELEQPVKKKNRGWLQPFRFAS